VRSFDVDNIDKDLAIHHQSLLSSVGLERLTVIVNCHQKVLCSTQREEISFCFCTQAYLVHVGTEQRFILHYAYLYRSINLLLNQMNSRHNIQRCHLTVTRRHFHRPSPPWTILMISIRVALLQTIELFLDELGQLTL
jgi:hypothetical protein